jgi:hypothetical protein
MAKARRATRKRKAGTRRRKASGESLEAKVKKAVTELQKTFQVAKIVGSAKDGKLELKTDCDDIAIKFISLNAPFKTKALVSAP